VKWLSGTGPIGVRWRAGRRTGSEPKRARTTPPPSSSDPMNHTPPAQTGATTTMSRTEVKAALESTSPEELDALLKRPRRSEPLPTNLSDYRKVTCKQLPNTSKIASMNARPSAIRNLSGGQCLRRAATAWMDCWTTSPNWRVRAEHTRRRSHETPPKSSSARAPGNSSRPSRALRH
jgi:hypothetical protein